MDNDLFTVLHQKASGFSKGHRLLARYITESYDKAAYMTASNLGKAVGVSESTVVRFAAELGYDGYRGMQKAMQEIVLNRLTAVQRIEVSTDRISSEDVITTVLHADADKLLQTVDMVDREAFLSAIKAVQNAKRIYVLGARSAAPLANFFGYYLNFMFNNVKIVTASGASEMFEKLFRVNGEDVIIAFSFPRYSAATVKGAQYCRTTGATVIGFTDSYFSPLCQHCDHVLLAKSDMVSFVDSLTAPLSLINAMLAALSVGREQILAGSYDKLERVWEQYNVYEKRVDSK